jgi:hypothetical protein
MEPAGRSLFKRVKIKYGIGSCNTHKWGLLISILMLSRIICGNFYFSVFDFEK